MEQWKQWNKGTREQWSYGTMEHDQYGFKNLALWQRAQEMTLRIIRLTEELPSNHAASTIGRQVVASAGSIAANIAEGHGRYSLAAYRNHLSIARGSAAETDSWLDLLQRAGYIAPGIAEELHQECRTLMAGLTRQMRTLEARLGARKDYKLKESVAEYVESTEIPERLP